MILVADSATTETLSRAADEDVVQRYTVNISGNRPADLVVLRHRINVFLESSEKPVAVLRFGGPYSGALWLKGELVGEFWREPSGSYVVVEIEGGFKQPTPREGVDPVGYLLGRL